MSSPGGHVDSHSHGEPSCAREDGDDASDERPLKKARYAWQVKGKYHLKQPDIVENPSTPRSSEALPASEDECSSDSDSLDNEVAASAEQNLEILGDYLLKQDFNMVVRGVASVVSEAAATYPRYVPSRDIPAQAPSEHSEDVTAENVPLSLVRSRNSAEDQYLARWQARQMAKGFVDNTINRVLDSWTVAPVSSCRETGSALDVAEFFDNLPGNNTIENEGILMAISAHGLQNAPGSPQLSEPYCSEFRRAPESDDSCPSPTKGDSTNGECDAPAWRDLERPCICSHTLRENYASAQVRPLVPFHHRDPATPYAYLGRSAAVEAPATPDSNTSRGDSEGNKEESGSDQHIFNEHFDFMDAAVSFAIQNKGLTSFGTEYG